MVDEINIQRVSPTLHPSYYIALQEADTKNHPGYVDQTEYCGYLTREQLMTPGDQRTCNARWQELTSLANESMSRRLIKRIPENLLLTVFSAAIVSDPLAGVLLLSLMGGVFSIAEVDGNSNMMANRHNWMGHAVRIASHILAAPVTVMTHRVTSVIHPLIGALAAVGVHTTLTETASYSLVRTPYWLRDHFHDATKFFAQVTANLP